ncbi:MAG: hypothetical protein O9302_00400 [Cyclobacteriaceae bacterium]|jgi:hypothetical protein|nr:hypothetical protein [Cytophagales bacterium]MCZ8326491.1 hypothetical protein [Cyclobacteriaceae bacterium]
MQTTINYMKYMVNRLKLGLLIGALLSPFYIIQQCKAQTGARLSFSIAEIEGADIDFYKLPGYQVGIFKKIEVNDYVKAIADISFLDQYADFGQIDLSYQSVNVGFNFRAYPFKKGIFISTGFEGGFATKFKAERETVKISDKGRLGNSIGLGYSLDKIDIEARYLSTTNQQPFTRYFQLSLFYSLK